MLRERLGKELLVLDGGMGTLLQERGLTTGESPESWNITHPEILIEIHQKYIEAGSDIILTNTFGGNSIKYKDKNHTLEEVIQKGVENAKTACKKAGKEVLVALDVGPTGKFMEPYGDLSFEEALKTFEESIRYGVAAGVDLVYLETFYDENELKAAVTAAKATCNLPVFATATFDEAGRLLTGADVKKVITLLEELGVDALGINCGFGPEQMLALVKEMRTHTTLPIIVKPNAGLPKKIDGKLQYDVEPEEFGVLMKDIVSEGANIIGGCCGTTPEYILEMAADCLMDKP